MDANTTETSHTVRDTAEESLAPTQNIHANPPDGSEGWDALDADNKAQREKILNEHFLKAFERFKAGVSLAKIRMYYEKLGAKYSPVTFRKKWDELMKKHADMFN